MAILRDEAARRRAAESLRETLLVEASAGTGKTTTMVRRLLTLLTAIAPGEERPAQLTEIIAITFTERAAQEIKDRLRAGLFRALRTARGDEAGYISQALGDLEQAVIGTIHGLCSRILREYPIEAGVDVQFGVADERAAEEMQAKLWDEWLTREFHRGERPEDAPPALRLALEREIGTDTLRGVAQALLSHRAWPVAELICGQSAQIEWDRELQDLGDLLVRIEHENPTTGEKRPLRANQRGVYENMTGWLARLSACDDDRQRESFLLDSLPFGDTKTSEAFYAKITGLRAKITHGLVSIILRWLCRPANDADGPGFLAGYRRAKQAQGLLDFDDLLILARDLVRDRLDVRREVQEKYRYIIVDEFQDTDSVQTELIVYLAQEASEDDAALDVPWTEARLSPGKLCVVGDPKQSIYRFRGADIEAYGQVARIVGRDGTCHLRTNFRSHPQIIAAVNAIFGRNGVFRSAGLPATELPFRPEYQPLEARPDVEDDGEQRVVRLAPEGEAYETKLETGRPLEARLVAAAIRSIVHEGRLVTDPDSMRLRPARWGDVAVLCRTASNFDIVEREFRRVGVPYRVVGGKSFFEREEITRLIAVLTAIEQPGDALHVVAALRSPFFGVSDADLAEAVLVADSRFDYRDERADGLPESVRSAYQCLKELHECRRRETPSALVQALFDRTKVLSVYAQTPAGEQAVANLLKVLDEARCLEDEGPVPFRRLCEHLFALRQEGGEEGEASLDDEGGGRVQMLSVHKAKGLEFPIVVVLDLAAAMVRSGGSSAPKIVTIRRGHTENPDVALTLNRSLNDAAFCTARWQELNVADRERDEAEAVRLLYVALTRARDYLILPKVVNDPRGATWQDLIEAAPGADRWLRRMPECARPAVPSPDAASTMPDVEELFSRRDELTERRKRLGEEARRSLVAFRRPSLHEKERGTPEEEVPPTGVVVTSVEENQGRLLGTVVHAALESLAPGDESRIEQTIDPLAAEQGLTDENRRKAYELTRRGLSAEVVRRAYDGRRFWREVPVMLCKQRDGITEITRGICDLVYEQDGSLVLVDYKTDHGEPEDRKRLAEKYRNQIASYVESLTVAAGRPVAEAWLCLLGLGERAYEEQVLLTQ